MLLGLHFAVKAFQVIVRRNKQSHGFLMPTKDFSSIGIPTADLTKPLP